MKENSKRKIQVGVICHFKRDKKGNIIPESTIREPIYRDWTPELQAAEDEMILNFARSIRDDLIDYIEQHANITNFGTPEEQERYKQCRQQQAKEQQRKKNYKK